MKLPEQQALTLCQLSTRHLRTLAASAGLQTADEGRPALLKSLKAVLPADSKQQWVIQDAEGAAPGRMKGLLVSHGNDLYLYGGMPHTAFTSTRAVSATSFAYPEGETIFMKLSHAAGSKWQSVSCEGAIPESRTRIHSGHAGVVHRDTLYLVGNLQSPDVDTRPVLPTVIVMSYFHFPSQKWTRLQLRHAPEVCHYPMLAAYDDQLILFGGQTTLYENIPSQDALWTFDICTSTWRHRHPTGQLPEPHLAHVATGLAVVNGKAYALINDPEHSKRLEVYELDLVTWHWRKVPPVGTQPSCRRAASAVVVQGCWLVYGGLWTGEAFSTFHVFDFSKLSWSSPKLTGGVPQARYYHMATSLNNALVVLGGLDYLRPEYDRLQQVDTVQCIWRQAAPHSRDFDDTKLQNWQLGCAMRSMYEQQLFTDATLVVEGKRLHAHRAVLAAASPVFLRMFSSQMQEGASQSITMDDIDAEAAELLLQYIYGCLKPELTVAAAVALFRASDKYAMSSLHQQCTRLLQSLITFDNLCDLAELAELHNSTELLQACIQYMDSLQELEGILGSDTCSHLRNDPRLHSLLTNEQSNAACISKTSSVGRPLSASDVAYDVKKARVTL